jgi:hypothetical protein
MVSGALAALACILNIFPKNKSIKMHNVFSFFPPVMKKYFLSIVFLAAAVPSNAQLLNNNWKEDLSSSLNQFINCGSDGECAGFPGQVLHTIYKVNDFYSQQSRRYMTVGEIAKFLAETRTWTNLGKPYDQKILETAQSYANAKKAVVAVYQNAQGIGHVVVITPGALQLSGSWGLKVPNVASFLTSDPKKSFIDKALSFAFAKNMIKDVTIYSKVY